MRRRIFVLGNPLMREDNIALEVANRLRSRFPEIVFEEVESIDSIKGLPKKLFLMDAVAGVKEPCFISDLEKLHGGNVFSLHDLDSGFQLKLFKKMGKINEVKIIGIPQGIEIKNAVEEVAKLLEKEKF